jgi:hypothetical protein
LIYALLRALKLVGTPSGSVALAILGSVLAMMGMIVFMLFKRCAPPLSQSCAAIARIALFGMQERKTSGMGPFRSNRGLSARPVL